MHKRELQRSLKRNKDFCPRGWSLQNGVLHLKLRRTPQYDKYENTVKVNTTKVGTLVD